MIVYLLHNKGSDKKFVGISSKTEGDVRHRYKTSARRTRHHDIVIEDIRKHGINNFTITTLDECTTFEEAEERRTFWVDHLATAEPRGYNLPP